MPISIIEFTTDELEIICYGHISRCKSEEKFLVVKL